MPAHDAAPSRPATPGILSHVFSFVTRELDSFVTNATGGAVAFSGSSQTPTQDSSKRTRVLSKASSTKERRHKRSRRVDESDDDAYYIEDYTSDSRAQAQRRRRASPAPDTYSDHEHYHHAEWTPKQRELSSKKRATRRTTPVAESDPREEELSASDRELSPSPSSSPRPPRAALQRRRPSIAMPGALFGRSPSPAYQSDAPKTDDEDEKHVRFAPGITSPPLRQRKRIFDPDKESIAGPSNTRNASPKRPPPPPSPPSGYANARPAPPDSRPRVIKSVRDAVEKFSTEATDASILLPSSPDRGRIRVSSLEKGKARAVSPIGNESYVFARSTSRSVSRDISDEEHAGDTSGEMRVRGKERDLHNAKMEQKMRELGRSSREEGEDAEERERDKERIRLLEEEVQRLKDELARRTVDRDFSHPPPPPPPPPPPSGFISAPPRASTTTSSTARGNADPILSQARALLKHAGSPVEAPINGPSRRKGQPTVNIPSDKMAAFLNEMKTVRLRKVGGGGLAMSSLGSSSSTAQDNAKIGEKRKRDDFDLPPPVPQYLKRRATLMAPDAPKTVTHFPNLSASTSRRPPSSFFPARRVPIPQPSTSQVASSSSAPAALNRSWRSSQSFTEPELTLTTPSLCSDNDNEPEERYEERSPSTPPLLPSHVHAQLKIKAPAKASGNQHDHEHDDRAGVEIFDVDSGRGAGVDTSQEPPKPPALLRSTTNRTRSAVDSHDIFSARPPSSPIPAASPRKPRPPGRPRIRQRVEDEDDPLALSYTADISRASLTPGERQQSHASRPRPQFRPRSGTLESRESRTMRRDAGDERERQRSTSTDGANRPASRSRSRSRSMSQAELRPSQTKRRRTLDDEIREAAQALSSTDRDGLESDGDPDERAMESGILTGVGSRSKRTGFLAHGGAGGPPVHMGVGYVIDAREGDHFGEEAEGEEADDDDDYLPSRSQRSTRSASTAKKSLGAAATGSGRRRSAKRR